MILLGNAIEALPHLRALRAQREMRRLEKAGQAKSTAYKEQACEFAWLRAIMDR